MKEQILQLFTKLNKIIEEKIETGELNKDIKFHSGIIPNKKWKYSSQEEERWYLWLCLVQKWIRERHEINIIIMHNFSESWGAEKEKYEYRIWDYKNPIFNFKSIILSSYMEALEQAIFNSLQLIINLYEKDKKN